jgi:tetratricopeptide (TPR) repeat protein
MDVSIATLLQEAVRLHREGALDEAMRRYAQILEEDPINADAQYYAAIVAYQRGEFDQALHAAEDGVVAHPRDARMHHLLGHVLLRIGRTEEALASFEHAITCAPDMAEAHGSRGDALSLLGRKAEAVASYDRALALQPASVTDWSNRGASLQDLGEFEKAVESYGRAIALKPNFAEAHFNRGNILTRLERHDEAVASYDRAIALKPDFAAALNNRGLALKALDRHEEALSSLDQALAIRPDYVEALCNRGVTLKILKRYDEALASIDKALAIIPDHVEALCNRGNILRDFNRFEEALAIYDRVLALRPDDAAAWANHGSILFEFRRFDEAFTSFEKAVALKPDYAEAHFNEVYGRLLVGDFDRGWEKFEWRWETDLMRGSKPDYPQPHWRGDSDISGKRFLAHASDGLGDTIEFCRYARLLRERNATVILAVQPSLKRLLSGMSDVETVIADGDPLPDFDVHCSIMSLPHAFRTRLENIPPCPQIKIPGDIIDKWAARLGRKDKPRIGIAWSGNPANQRDAWRSMTLEDMLPLTQLPAQFFSLQKEIRPGDQQTLENSGARIAHFGPELTDFLESAGLVSQMDLVIAVDTAIAHLCATIGRPIWILLAYVPDWRWLLDRDDSPWYPSARLFRQDATRDWPSVIRRVETALRDFLKACPPGGSAGVR